MEVVDDDAVVEARQPHFTGQMFAIADAPHISVVTAANGHALSCRPSAHTAVTVDTAVVVGVGVGVDVVEVVVVVVGVAAGAGDGRSSTTWPFTASEVGASDGGMLVLVGGVAVGCIMFALMSDSISSSSSLAFFLASFFSS